MSAKGCSPDNAAAEGFLGRLKQEFFYERSFTGVSMDGFIDTPDDCMTWHRDRRIKTESRRGHHGPAQDAGACGMIGGDGINDESNKTSPAPHLRVTWFGLFRKHPCNRRSKNNQRSTGQKLHIAKNLSITPF